MKSIASFLFSADSMVGCIICSLLYVVIYDISYYQFVYELFGYMGDVDYIEPGVAGRILLIVISTTPILFFKGIKGISSFATLMIFLFFYIPFVHALTFMWNLDFATRYIYILLAFALMCLYFRADNSKPLFKFLKLQPAIPMWSIELLACVLTFVFVMARAGSMHFVNFFTDSAALYDFREENSEAAQGLGPIVYVQGWLSGAFYPFLLICYLKAKKWLKGCLVLTGYVLLFMVDMQKLTFFLPFLLTISYFFIKRYQQYVSKGLHSTVIFAVCSISLVLLIFKDNEIVFTLGAIFLLRTVCVSGWLTQMYVHFFNENPYTYYSHISVVNAFTNSYPYTQSLGRTVAYNTQNANATFFLTDGIASMGIPGFLIIGIVFLLLLHFLNAISYRYNRYELLVAFIPAIAYLLNASIFTVFLTNGFVFLILLVIGSNNLLCTEEDRGLIYNGKDKKALSCIFK